MKKLISFSCTFLLVISAENLSALQPFLHDPVVERINISFQFLEGPVWKDGRILFSDIPANKIYQWTEEEGSSVFLMASGNSNGLALDSKGRLLLAQHGKRQVAVLLDNGSDSTLAGMYEGKKLNSPNDITVRSDDAFYFTDPPYGIDPGDAELDYSGIFLYTASGELHLMDKSLNRPNGIVLSPDESILYVSDSETRKIYTWQIDGDTILNKTLFASMTPAGNADGMKVDGNGFLYASGPGGVWVYNPDGTFIQTIPVPGQVTNCGWGAEEDTVLFVTTGNYLFRITNRKEDPVTYIKDNVTKSIHLRLLSSNPFTDHLRFSCTLGDASDIKLDIYDLNGRLIKRLAEGFMPAGIYTYSWETGYLCAGAYIVRLNSRSTNTVMYCIKMGAY